MKKRQRKKNRKIGQLSISNPKFKGRCRHKWVLIKIDVDWQEKLYKCSNCDITTVDYY